MKHLEAPLIEKNILSLQQTLDPQPIKNLIRQSIQNFKVPKPHETLSEAYVAELSNLFESQQFFKFIEKLLEADYPIFDNWAKFTFKFATLSPQQIAILYNRFPAVIRIDDNFISNLLNMDSEELMVSKDWPIPDDSKIQERLLEQSIAWLTENIDVERINDNKNLAKEKHNRQLEILNRILLPLSRNASIKFDERINLAAPLKSYFIKSFEGYLVPAIQELEETPKEIQEKTEQRFQEKLQKYQNSTGTSNGRKKKIERRKLIQLKEDAHREVMDEIQAEPAEYTPLDSIRETLVACVPKIIADVFVEYHEIWDQTSQLLDQYKTKIIYDAKNLSIQDCEQTVDLLHLSLVYGNLLAGVVVHISKDQTIQDDYPSLRAFEDTYPYEKKLSEFIVDYVNNLDTRLKQALDFYHQGLARLKRLLQEVDLLGTLTNQQTHIESILDAYYTKYPEELSNLLVEIEPSASLGSNNSDTRLNTEPQPRESSKGQNASKITAKSKKKHHKPEFSQKASEQQPLVNTDPTTDLGSASIEGRVERPLAEPSPLSTLTSVTETLSQSVLPKEESKNDESGVGKKIKHKKVSTIKEETKENFPGDSPIIQFIQPTFFNKLQNKNRILHEEYLAQLDEKISRTKDIIDNVKSYLTDIKSMKKVNISVQDLFNLIPKDSGIMPDKTSKGGAIKIGTNIDERIAFPPSPSKIKTESQAKTTKAKKGKAADTQASDICTKQTEISIEKLAPLTFHTPHGNKSNGKKLPPQFIRNTVESLGTYLEKLEEALQKFEAEKVTCDMEMNASHHPRGF